MPHRIMNALTRRVPQAVVRIEHLAADIGIPKRELMPIVRRAAKIGLIAFWSEIGAVVMAPEEAERIGLELRSNGRPAPGPDDWRWVKVGATSDAAASRKARTA